MVVEVPGLMTITGTMKSEEFVGEETTCTFSRQRLVAERPISSSSVGSHGGVLTWVGGLSARERNESTAITAVTASMIIRKTAEARVRARRPLNRCPRLAHRILVRGAFDNRSALSIIALAVS